MKNHELSSDIPDSTIETQWSDLEKMDEEGFRDKKESANNSEQKSPEQKEAELQLAATKVRESFASRAEAQKEQPVSQIYNTETNPATSTPTPGSIIRRFLSDRQVRQIDKLANGDHRGIGRNQRKDRLKVISLVESGKVNLDNPSIANNYMRVKLSQPEYIVSEGGQRRYKTSLEKIEDMARVGIEPERPAMLIAESIVAKMNDSLNKENSSYYDQQFAIERNKLSSSDDVVSLAEMSEVVEKYNIPEICDIIRQNVDVQSFGDKAIDYALERSHYGIEQESASVAKQIEQSRRGIDFLRKMGYEPFKNGVESLFSDYGSVSKQIIAEKFSLIDEDTVDSMYQYKFRTLNDAISNHRYGNDMPILESLRCSGKDAFALFWEQRSRETGEDELSTLAKKANEHSSGSMIAEMARDYSESDDQENNPLNFILNNPGLLSGPDRGFIIWLNSVIAEASNRGIKEQDKRHSVKEAVNSILRFQHKNRDGYRLFFDEDGISDTAREMAIFDDGVRSIMEKFDPIWKSHFSSDMQEAIDSYRREDYMLEHPDLLSELTPRRKSLVELIAKHPGNQLRSLETADLSQYFDEDGNLTPKLAEDLFADDYFGNNRRFLCSCPEIYATLPPIQQSYLETLHKIEAPKKVLGLSNQEIAQYFDEKGPKPEFWQFEFSAGDLSGMTSYLKKTATHDENGKTNYNYGELGLSKVQESVLRFYGNAKWFIQDLRDFIEANELEKYFDENGPKDEFWQFEFSKGHFESILRYVHHQNKDMFVASDSPFGYSRRMRHKENVDYAPLGLSKNQIEALSIYGEIDDEVAKNDFRLFASDSCDEIPLRRIKIAPQLLSRLAISNASEVVAGRSNLAKRLLNTDLEDDEKMFKSFEKIEEVFLHNNLPYVGKVFRTFRILYPVGETDPSRNPAIKAMERGALKGLPESGPRSKDAILFNDLLKASFRSNNRDLRKYLLDLKSGDELSEKVISGQDDFSSEEMENLSDYYEHLRTLYDNTKKGAGTPFEPSGNVIMDVKSLVALFGPTKRHSMLDRIVRSFGFGIGITSYDEAIARMDQAASTADSRNRKAAEGDFSLQSGDLIKSVAIEYLGQILQNGSICKEFLNGEAETDSTPLDADLNILPEGLSGNISEGVDKKNSIAAFGAMHCMLVMKGDENSGRNRFQMEENNEGYDPDKYEVWHNNGDNYGIRVGFPSTEIDYIIFDDFGENNNYGDLERIKFEVARNGFYIPIIDKKSGELVYSPEEYDKFRERTMSGLSHYGDSEYHFASEIESSDLGPYTLGETTIPSTAEIIAQSENNREEVDHKRNAILNQVVMPVLEQFGFGYKPHLDGDLTEGTAEFIDTGSTGRYANTPGDGDFDFMMRLDRSVYTDQGKMDEIRDAFCELLGITDPGQKKQAIKDGNFRAKNVHLEGLEKPVDIDITFVQKTNKVLYSTDMALADYYSSMPEDKRREVVANVVFAKKLLKLVGAYKPDRGDKPQGGLGGVGVENWILQNGGSFLVAAHSFIDAVKKAEANAVGIMDEFSNFKKIYAVWDFGENHMPKGKKQHDNFVTDNMSAEGYEKMKRALTEFLSQYS